MADEETSTVAEGASTSAPAETVEETTQVSEEVPAVEEPRTADDVWDSIDAEEEETEGEEKTEEKTEDKPEDKPAATPADAEDAEDKTEEKTEEKETEKTPEEEALEEAFADESEKPADESEEDLSKMSEEEIRERQRNKYAREYLDRVSKRAETVKRFQFDDTPIAEVADEFKSISEQRFEEFSQYAAHQLVDANPDATFRRAYAVKMLQKNPNWDVANATYPSLDELIAGDGTPPKADTEKPALSSPPPELRQVTADLDKALGWDWRNPALDENFVDERELAMAKTIRTLEAKAAEEATQLKELNEKLEDLTTNRQSVEQQQAEADLQKEVQDFRTDLEKTLLPYIAKSNGLEISPDDTPEIKAFKQKQMELFTGSEWDRANGYSSQFEQFAYNESSVRNELETIGKRVVAAQIKKLQAKAMNNKADVDKYQREIADEKLPMSQLLGQANKEFKKLNIDPIMAVIGRLSSKLAEPIKEASERIEVVSGSSQGATKPQKKDYATADDVWGGMVEDAAQEEKLRATT